MTKDDAPKYKVLIDALIAGATIQLTTDLTNPEWRDCQKVFFSWPVEHYRIKPPPPAPRRVWVNCYPDGRMGKLWMTKAEAERWRDDNGVTTEFVEVIV